MALDCDPGTQDNQKFRILLSYTVGLRSTWVTEKKKCVMLDNDKWCVCVGGETAELGMLENRLYFCVGHPNTFSKKIKGERFSTAPSLSCAF